MKRKLLVFLTVAAVLFGVAATNRWLPDYPLRTTLADGDRIPFSWSNSPSYLPTANITKYDLFQQIESEVGVGVSDGDKGDVVVSGGGSIWNLDTGVVDWSELTGIPAGFADGTDDGAGGSGDSILVNATAVTDSVSLTNTPATATVPSITWSVTAGADPIPDLASGVVGLASATDAGAVSASAQTIGGLKSFTGGIAATNSVGYFSGPIWHDWETVSGTEIDSSTGNSFTKTIAANLTFTVVNAVDGYTFRLRIVENATGGFTVTGPSHIPINATNQTAATSMDVNTNANAITTFYFTRIGGTWEMRGPDTMSSVPLTEFSSGNMSSAEFGAQITDDVGTNGVMRTRVGVVRSFALPMGAWFTNGLASVPTPTSYTNSSDSHGFVDGATNTIRIRFPMPISWDAGTVKLQLQAGTTATNETTSTNVVWSIKAAKIDANQVGDDEVNLTFGTAVTVTNHIHKGPYISTACVTPSITVGNTPQVNDDIVWELTRLTTDGADVNTNTVYLLSAQVFYTESATEPSMPATTN